MAPPYDQTLITNLSPTTFADEGSMVTTSSYGVLMPRFTGFTSVICSLLIIYLILRSPTRLLSSYHRIMFGMSIFDVLTSTAMGLTTLPMPRDDPVVTSYGFHGTRLGNFGTCTAQGFSWLLGIYAANGYNMILLVYYFFSIGLLLKKCVIQRFIEPLLHLTVLTVSLTMAILPLVSENYNPSIQNPWCTTYPFKVRIDEEEGTELKDITLRGNDEKWKEFRNLFGITTIVYICVSIFCLCFITIAECIRNRKQRHHHHQSDEEQQQHRQEGESTEDVANAINTHNQNHNNADGDYTDNHIHSETKIIVIHSLCYLLSMSLTAIFPRIRVYSRVIGSEEDEEVWIEMLYFFFLPLQGFFNFLIFVGSKIAWIRMIQPDLTVVKALNQMFCKPKPDPFIMTSLDIVDNDRQEEAERIRRIELQRRQECDSSTVNSGDESSKTPSRANTNDRNVEYVIRQNIDRHGLRRFGTMASSNNAGNKNLSLVVDAADPTARNVGDQILTNETGLLKEDELIVRTDYYDIEPIHNSTTSNQYTSIDECSNNAAGISNLSPPRRIDDIYMGKFNIAYPKSSQASSGNMSNSLGGFTNMSDDMNNGTQT